MSDISTCHYFHYISYIQTQANNYLNNNMVQRADTAAFDSQHVCMADIRNSSAFALWNPFTPPLLPKRPSNLQRSSLHPQTCANFGTPFTTNTRLKAPRLAKQGLARFSAFTKHYNKFWEALLSSIYRPNQQYTRLSKGWRNVNHCWSYRWSINSVKFKFKKIDWEISL